MRATYTIGRHQNRSRTQSARAFCHSHCWSGLAGRQERRGGPARLLLPPLRRDRKRAWAECDRVSRDLHRRLRLSSRPRGKNCGWGRRGLLRNRHRPDYFLLFFGKLGRAPQARARRIFSTMLSNRRALHKSFEVMRMIRTRQCLMLEPGAAGNVHFLNRLFRLAT